MGISLYESLDFDFNLNGVSLFIDCARKYPFFHGHVGGGPLLSRINSTLENIDLVSSVRNPVDHLTSLIMHIRRGKKFPLRKDSNELFTVDFIERHINFLETIKPAA